MLKDFEKHLGWKHPEHCGSGLQIVNIVQEFEYKPQAYRTGGLWDDGGRFQVAYDQVTPWNESMEERP